MGDWLGKKLMNPEGKVGIVIDDSNGIHRILETKFEDGTKEELWLSNMGENPERSRDWSWEYEDRKTKEKKWVKFGKF